MQRAWNLRFTQNYGTSTIIAFLVGWFQLFKHVELTTCLISLDASTQPFKLILHWIPCFSSCCIRLYRYDKQNFIFRAPTFFHTTLFFVYINATLYLGMIFLRELNLSYDDDSLWEQNVLEKVFEEDQIRMLYFFLIFICSLKVWLNL